MKNNKGQLYVVSAPSGAGKTSLVDALLEIDNHVEVSVSHTTREPRPGEQDGISYNFVSIEDFETLLNKSEFLEHAKVFDNYYGTSKAWVEERLNAGKDIVLILDWQGARTTRELLPDTLSIFILPPSKTELENRLKERGQDSKEIIKKRMAQAVSESEHYSEYDYLIFNDDFDTALLELSSILIANRATKKNQIIKNQDILSKLLS